MEKLHPVFFWEKHWEIGSVGLGNGEVIQSCLHGWVSAVQLPVGKPPNTQAQGVLLGESSR